jgi:hypothetical protein
MLLEYKAVKDISLTLSSLAFVCLAGLGSCAWAHTDVTPQEANEQVLVLVRGLTRMLRRRKPMT